MKNIHQPIKEIMKYYAIKLENETASLVINKEAIESEGEAKEFLSFLETMCNTIAVDAKESVVVLNQPIHTTDAEKVCDIMEDYIEGLGYGHLID